jgi:general stress protein YciG
MRNHDQSPDDEGRFTGDSGRSGQDYRLRDNAGRYGSSRSGGQNDEWRTERAGKAGAQTANDLKK